MDKENKLLNDDLVKLDGNKRESVGNVLAGEKTVDDQSVIVSGSDRHVVEKNDVIELRIEDLGSQGEGIGKINGYALFVKDALIGDLVKVKVIKTKKSYGYARLMEILEPSEHRVEPRCGVARQCGGCQIQHLDYAEQLKFKDEKIKNCLVRIGGFDRDFVDSVMEPLIGMEDPYYYRNKAQFPVGVNKDGRVIAGFYAGRTHSIVDASTCFIQAAVNERILEVVKGFLEEFGVTVYDEVSHKGLVRHVMTRVGFVTKEIMVCLVLNGEVLPKADVLVERLCEIDGMKSICVNVNREITNVIMGEKVICLWGEPFITDYIGEVQYRISPLSFYQVNPVQTRKLYELALEYAGLGGNEVVWDLYCGIGTISLFLAKRAKKVYGVEIVKEAIEDARVNAQINGIRNAEFLVGAAEVVVPELVERFDEGVDVVVVDPPRKGCDVGVLETIVSVGAKRIVYVSCDPGTLARDLKYLCGRGYEVLRGQGVDQFGHSVHVEIIVELYRTIY